jgi:hypothetical protein
MYVTFDHSQFRLGHDELLNGPKGFKQFELWVKSNGVLGKQSISSSQPTRIGKGEQMRSLAVAAVRGWIDKHGEQHDPVASLVILASPSETLAKQVINKKKYRRTYERFGMDPALAVSVKMQRVTAKTDAKSYEALDDHGRIQIISCTNSMILSRAGQFTELCQKRREATGLPVLVWFDEAHRLGQETKTHGLAELLTAEAQILSITMTATPSRKDGGLILGFTDLVDAVKESVRKQVVGTNADDPNLVDVNINRHVETRFFQRADIPVPWDYAWNNNCLCKINIGEVNIEVDVVADSLSGDEGDLVRTAFDGARSAWGASQNESDEPGQEADSGAGDGEGKKSLKFLHELYNEKTGEIISEGLVRKIIGLAVRDEKVIRAAIRKALAFLVARRKIAPASRMVVFGGNDRPDGSDNEHLMQILRIIKSEWRAYFPGTDVRAMVCTMKDESTASADSVNDRLEEFEEGPYDVILLKQMASEGWDTLTTKVGVNLSPIRSFPFIIQTTMRVGTPWEYKPGHVMITADWVTINDPFQALFGKWLHDSQGPITRSVAVETIDTDIDEKGSGPDTPGRTVTIKDGVAGGTSFYGHSSTWLEVDSSQIVATIRRRFPELQTTMTDQLLWELYQRGAFPDCTPGSEPEGDGFSDDAFQDEGATCRQCISEVQALLKEYVAAALRKCRGERLNGSFGEAVSTLAGEVVDEHNRKHPRDAVPNKFSGVTNPDVAKRFLATAASTAWHGVAQRIIRQLLDRQAAASRSPF